MQDSGFPPCRISKGLLYPPQRKIDVSPRKPALYFHRTVFRTDLPTKLVFSGSGLSAYLRCRWNNAARNRAPIRLEP